MNYECIVVGGGLAGLQAAIQLGRYGHRTLVIDKGSGRSTLCRCYHNLLGWPEGVSGEELRRLGRTAAERTGVRFVTDEASHIAKKSGGFEVTTLGNSSVPYAASTLLLATGVSDRFPSLPGIVGCLGQTVYICPDCDGYEIRGRRTIVMGSGDVGARMALTLSYWCDQLLYINHERQPINESIALELNGLGIALLEKTIDRVLVAADDPSSFAGVRFTDGSELAGERAFIAFGGNKVHTDIAQSIGIERMENKHIVTDPRTKMTSVPGIWAAGDIGVHSEQAAIAIGEGLQAAIWMHKMLNGMRNTRDNLCRT